MLPTLSQAQKRNFAKAIALVIPITVASLVIVSGFYFYDKKAQISANIVKVVNRQIGQISSQLTIYRIYRIAPDPALIEMFREVESNAVIGLRNNAGDCLLGDCAVFNVKPNRLEIHSMSDVYSGDELMGTLAVYVPLQKTFFQGLAVILGLIFGSAILQLIVNQTFSRRWINRELHLPFYELMDLFSKLESRRFGEIEKAALDFTQVKEVREIFDRFKSLSSRIERLYQTEQENHKQRALAELATQVAHDIRSPLAAINALERDLATLPEETRLMLRGAVNRIRDIANNLLERNRETSVKSEATSEVQVMTESVSPHLLSSLIEPLLSEKRLQFRSKMGIEIDGRFDPSSYGLFANIQSTEFKRVLSNLINNAVEAMDKRGRIGVGLALRSDGIEIVIQDNGKGIPSDLIAKLGVRGETHGKSGGSGLGLYHARSTIESWGGSLRIDSQADPRALTGTTITIQLPPVPPPKWFLSDLNLVQGGSLVILDDDTSIHQIWQGRFESLRVADLGVQIYHLSTPDQLRAWFREHGNHNSGNHNSKDALYLTDYELLGFKDTGLSLVEELNIADQSVLVTSRFEEPAIREACERLKVKMIPKGIAGFVPISVKKKAAPPAPEPAIASVTPPATASAITVDAVLIDDDDLVHMMWRMAADAAGKKIQIYFNPEEFLKKVDSIPKSCAIYVDSNLGQGIRGERVAEQIHHLGFHRVYLATGYEPERFREYAFLAGVIGKKPPF